VIDRRFAALLTLMVVIPGAVMTLRDFRDGRSRLWLSGGIVPLQASRDASPLFFWAYTALNVVVCGLLAVAGAAILVGGVFA
jgi:hypothetical protein